MSEESDKKLIDEAVDAATTAMQDKINALQTAINGTFSLLQGQIIALRNALNDKADKNKSTYQNWAEGGNIGKSTVIVMEASATSLKASATGANGSLNGGTFSLTGINMAAGIKCMSDWVSNTAINGTSVTEDLTAKYNTLKTKVDTLSNRINATLHILGGT